MVEIPKLRELRERRALTQVELAERAGLSSRSVAGYEAGAGARPGTVRKLARALGVRVTDLFGGGWQEAFENSRRFRATAKQRLTDRLSTWEAAKDASASDEERREVLDEVGLILDEATEALSDLQENLREGLDHMAEAGPNPYWEEVRKIDRLYRELLAMVGDAGLSVRPATMSNVARHQHKLEVLAG
jgi:transcriptional regulator with XRE-family HTH domain